MTDAGTDALRRPATVTTWTTTPAVLISSVPPLMVQTDANPAGLPKSVFDGLQGQLAANRSEFYRALPSGPFYGLTGRASMRRRRSSTTGGAKE
jgi:hypothetical protein